MRYSVVTLFPNMFHAITSEGVIARAINQNIIKIETIQLRDFANNPRKNVDDHPAGGGDGMVIRADVTEQALNFVRGEKSTVILTSPRGKVFSNQAAKKLAEKEHLIFLCGRYAGFDERFIEQHVDESYSVGDFVLSGGELASMCMIDTICRFIPGVLGNADSASQDSFEDGLLEAPLYTKPTKFHDKEIPAILLSGDHKKILEYKRMEQIRITATNRPDLIYLNWNNFTKQEKTFIEKIWKQNISTF